MRVAKWSGWLSWLQWRGAGATPLVGVDIAPDGVRVVELQWAVRVLPGSRDRRVPHIAHHAQLPLDAGAWQSALEGDPQVLVDTLKRVLKASGTRQRHAALALPATSVITRTLCLPRPAHDEELEMLVEADAAQSLPYPRDEISLDFALLGHSAHEEGMVDVLLVAARRERIAQRIAWAEAAGLKAAVVGVETQAVIAAINGMCGGDRHTVGILHFSGGDAHCLFVCGARLLFERELGMSLPDMTNRGAGLPAAELDSWIDAISLEWQRHAQLFAATAMSGAIDRIHLAGAGTLGPQLATGLRQRLQMDVSVPSPFLLWPDLQRKRASDQPAGAGQAHNDPHDDGASCLLACGLALSGLR